MRSDIQKNSTQQDRAEHRLLPNLSAVPVLLVLLWFSQQALAATTDERFQQYISDICFAVINPPPGVVWNIAAMCTATSTGFAGSGGVVSANLGTSDTGKTTAAPKGSESHECLDDLGLKPDPKKKGCATGSWGLLTSIQFGRSTRPETELENGFQSDLGGLLLGLDYRFTDSFILGAATGVTQDEAKFVNNAGSLKTANNTFTVYGTWLPSEKISVDGYLGYGAVKFNSQRTVVFGTVISGTASGSTAGQQAMIGVSSAYEVSWGKINLSPFINFDYIKTDINSFNETGTTLLELHYGKRTTISSTASLGTRASTAYSYSWGSLIPSVRLAAVHEFQNNASQLSNELVITPGAGFLVETDAPDRDYFLSGFGVVAAFGKGSQLFFNFERRSGDSLLDSWVSSLGFVKEF